MLLLVSANKETSINRKRNATSRSRSRSAISIGRATIPIESRDTKVHTAAAVDCVARICRGLKNSRESGRIGATWLTAVIKYNFVVASFSRSSSLSFSLFSSLLLFQILFACFARKSTHPVHPTAVYAIPFWTCVRVPRRRKGAPARIHGRARVCTQIKYLRRFACKNTHVRPGARKIYRSTNLFFVRKSIIRRSTNFCD